MIYAIQAGEGGPVKIGVARNPWARLMDLQIGNAETLRVVEAIEAPDGNEWLLHNRLKEHSIRGEWFRPHEEVFGVLLDFKVSILLGEDGNTGESCAHCRMSIAYGLWLDRDPENNAESSAAARAGFQKEVE